MDSRILLDAMHRKYPGWSHYFVNGPYVDGSIYAGCWEYPSPVSGHVFCEKGITVSEVLSKIEGEA